MDKIPSPLEKLFETGETLTFGRHEVILDTENGDDSVYYVHDGNLKLVSYANNGEERIHYIFRAGEVFPVESLFGKWGRHGCYVSMGASVVKRVPMAEALKYFDEHPIAYRQIVLQLLNLLDRVYNLNLDAPMERVIDRLLVLGKRIGKNLDGNILLDSSMSQQELAASVHLSRETVSKLLHQLQARKAILIGRGQILIFPDRLRKVQAEFEASMYKAGTNSTIEPVS